MENVERQACGRVIYCFAPLEKGSLVLIGTKFGIRSGVSERCLAVFAHSCGDACLPASHGNANTVGLEWPPNGFKWLRPAIALAQPRGAAFASVASLFSPAKVVPACTASLRRSRTLFLGAIDRAVEELSAHD